MHGHTLCDTDPDRRDFANSIDPDSRSTFDATTDDPKVSEKIDDAAFDLTDISDKFLGVAKSKDRISDQLPWTMPCDLPASINIDDRSG